jgi:hypothetical protein
MQLGAAILCAAFAAPVGAAVLYKSVGPDPYEDPSEVDATVARASAQLDLAEHALAEARRSVTADHDPMRMVSMRMSSSDMQRIEFYKKNVLLARQNLLEVLKDKREAAVPQVMTAANEWTPVSAIRTEANPLSPVARR